MEFLNHLIMNVSLPIKVINSPGSSSKILSSFNKIITFQGTIQYEAVLAGKKPIIIKNSELKKNFQN